MRYALLFCLLAMCHVASAQELQVSRGSMNVNQLHQELLSAFPSWRGASLPDGSFENPLLSVESTAQEVRLSFPDGTDVQQVHAVIQAHQPIPPLTPTQRTQAHQAAVARIRTKLGLTLQEMADLKEALR